MLWIGPWIMGEMTDTAIEKNYNLISRSWGGKSSNGRLKKSSMSSKSEMLLLNVGNSIPLLLIKLIIFNFLLSQAFILNF